MSSDKLVREKLRVGVSRAECAHPFEVDELKVVKDEGPTPPDAYSKPFDKKEAEK